MGIYTDNRYFSEAYDYASEISANEAYKASLGCAQILADCQTNDMALFESIIYNDFAEVKALQEGYDYVNENAFTDVIKKIVEMFKKLLAKIKGIFKSFLVKLTGAFKNGKDLVKKYEKQIIKYSNWKGFKCKGIREPKNKSSLQSAIDNLFQTNKICAVGYEIETANTNMLTDTHLRTLTTVEKIKNADASDIKNEIIELYVPDAKVTDIADLHEEVMDYLFDDEDTIDDDKVNSSSYFSQNWIKTILSEGEKWQKDVKKFNDKLEKNINTIIDNLNKDDDKLAKFILNNKDNKKIGGNNYSRGGRVKGHHYANNYAASDGNNKVTKSSGTDFIDNTDILVAASNKNAREPEDLQNAIHALQTLAGNEQEVITRITSEYMTIVKFSLAQARKLWTAAAAWSSGVHKESVEFVNAAADSAAEQFYSIMEAV